MPSFLLYGLIALGAYWVLTKNKKSTSSTQGGQSLANEAKQAIEEQIKENPAFETPNSTRVVQEGTIKPQVGPLQGATATASSNPSIPTQGVVSERNTDLWHQSVTFKRMTPPKGADAFTVNRNQARILKAVKLNAKIKWGNAGKPINARQWIVSSTTEKVTGQSAGEALRKRLQTTASKYPKSVVYVDVASIPKFSLPATHPGLTSPEALKNYQEYRKANEKNYKITIPVVGKSNIRQQLFYVLANAESGMSAGSKAAVDWVVKWANESARLGQKVGNSVAGFIQKITPSSPKKAAPLAPLDPSVKVGASKPPTPQKGTVQITNSGIPPKGTIRIRPTF